ncbi:MAG: YaaA family protein, partial [Muribaculaceae bacterium]|nr:YaaA family protein [Muribaculaceae bacterium]
MIILIAESKTMVEQEMPVDLQELQAHTPVDEGMADSIMERIAGMPADEIAEIVRVSPNMAAGIMRMAYEFPNKQTGLMAMEAYTGVVFKAFDYKSLSVEQKQNTCACVRIISSLYGWLRPDDIIKRYRLDYTTPIAQGDQTLWACQRNETTAQLLKDLQESGQRDILNLLPENAEKCIDWKQVKSLAKMRKVDFKEMTDGGALRTPNAGRLKTMRGTLLREIIERGIDSPTQLTSLHT